MKIRTDFVTNSSSSSFVFMIRFELTDGSEVRFDAHGVSPEDSPLDYFDSEACVYVSPKQLGTAKNIEELLSLLANGVYNGNPNRYKYYKDVSFYYGPVFDKSHPVKCSIWDDDKDEIVDKIMNPYDFVSEFKEKVKSMDQIAKVTIASEEESYETCYRTYTYDRITKEYTGRQFGRSMDELENEGQGGELVLQDLGACKMEYYGDLDDYDDAPYDLAELGTFEVEPNEG